MPNSTIRNAPGCKKLRVPNKYQPPGQYETHRTNHALYEHDGAVREIGPLPVPLSKEAEAAVAAQLGKTPFVVVEQIHYADRLPTVNAEG